MTKNPRIEVTSTIDDYFDIECSVKSVYEELGRILQEYPNAYFDKDYHGYDGGFTLKIKYTRLENDQEYEKRMKLEEEWKKRQRETKQARIEKLKKELEEIEKEE